VCVRERVIDTHTQTKTQRSEGRYLISFLYGTMTHTSVYDTLLVGTLVPNLNQSSSSLFLLDICFSNKITSFVF